MAVTLTIPDDVVQFLKLPRQTMMEAELRQEMAFALLKAMKASEIPDLLKRGHAENPTRVLKPSQTSQPPSNTA